MNNKILLLGELIFDETIPVKISEKRASAHGGAEQLIYEDIDQGEKEWKTLGGVWYWARFLYEFFKQEDIHVIFPQPAHGRRIKKEDWAYYLNLRDMIKNTAVDTSKSLVRIVRYVEVEESMKNFEPIQRGILRIDPQSFDKVNYNDANAVLEKFCKQYNSTFSEGSYHNGFVVLADYNCGLFNHDLLEGVNNIVKNDINIVIYARKRWQKYASYFKNENCSIIADFAETVDELAASFNALCTEESIKENPFWCIIARFPNIKQVILVDRKRTHLMKKEKGKKVYDFYEYITDFRGFSVGHRALIGASLCLKNNIELPEKFLRQAHFAAIHCSHVLTGHFKKEHAQKIEEYNNNENCNKKSEAVTPIQELRCLLCTNNLKMDLTKANTGLDEYHTVNEILKSKIKDIKKFLNDSAKESCLAVLNPEKKIYVERLLIHGASRVGKTELVERLLEKLRPKDSPKKYILKCNKLIGNPDEIAKEIINFIETRDIAVLDEINNMGDKGANIQEKLLPYFEDVKPDAEIPIKKKIHKVVLIGSISEEKIKILKTSQSFENRSDFYGRFVNRKELPNLEECYLDAIYEIGIQLFEKKGIKEINLLGLLALAKLGSTFTERTQTSALISKLKVHIGTETELKEEWFNKYKKEIDLEMSNNIIYGRKMVQLIYHK